jgi:hypothetical protein
MTNATSVGSICGTVVLVILVVVIYILFYTQDRGNAGVHGRGGRNGKSGIRGPQGNDGPAAPPGPKGDEGPRGIAGTCSVVNVSHTRKLQPDKLENTVHFCRVGDMVSVEWSGVEMRGKNVAFVQIPVIFEPVLPVYASFTPLSAESWFIPAESYTVQLMILSPGTDTLTLLFTPPNGYETRKRGFGSMTYTAKPT